MSHFPVTNSTLSAPHIGQYLVEHYGLSPATTCTLFRTGINHSYIVTDGTRKYVFRVYSFNWRTEQEIAEELRLLNLLQAQGVLVSYAVADTQGELIQALPAPEGPRYGVLFTYAEGKKVRDFSLETSYQLGTLMARLHLITQGVTLDRVTYSLDTLVHLPYTYARIHFSEDNEEMQYIRKAGEYLRAEFEKIDNSKVRRGAIHLDLWYDNMHITDASEITLFDFDFCGNGYLFYDLAYTTMQLYHTEPDKQKYQEKLKHFWAGYESVTPLDEEEKRWLPQAGLAIWIFYLGVQSQRFDNWSNFFLSENYLKRYLGMAKEWLAYHQIQIN
ncbi:phosphotransferase enzyme family protein [Telluribacter sp. SYSU D00476]|uniref:phosphotransferase enzyme family protein n=1 Tax=Telluribacter sp. SYSU D00476 TaxID=2811430 RepID=UPI001FF577A4|nr:phosphotransferase [Telluribacter sp. SYSU D00476]